MMGSGSQIWVPIQRFAYYLSDLRQMTAPGFSLIFKMEIICFVAKMTQNNALTALGIVPHSEDAFTEC